MTPEGILDAYRSLSGVLTSTGLGWIVHQVEDRVREGRPVEKEARIFKDEEPTEQVFATDGEAATARRSGKPTLMMTLEPWTDNCRLQFLIDAVRHAIVHAADVENEQLRLLRRYGDVKTVMFAPDESAPERQPFKIEGLEGKQIRLLADLLDALDREVRLE
jgi:hypothetical protein